MKEAIQVIAIIKTVTDIIIAILLIYVDGSKLFKSYMVLLKLDIKRGDIFHFLKCYKLYILALLKLNAPTYAEKQV